MTMGRMQDPGSRCSWGENGRTHFSQERWADPRRGERGTGHLHTTASHLAALRHPLRGWNRGRSGRYEVALPRLINTPAEQQAGGWCS